MQGVSSSTISAGKSPYDLYIVDARENPTKKIIWLISLEKESLYGLLG